MFGAFMFLCASRSGVARAEADVFAIGDGHSGAKSVTGDETVNAYAPLTADAFAGATTITIGTIIGTGTFAANDLVLVWRATGVDATTGSVASGEQTPLVLSGVESSDVGRWELARVASVAGSTVTLTKPLVNGWKKNVAQLVKVPEYTTLDVPAGARLMPKPWQKVGAGYAGGIIAVFANGTVTVNGTIDADAAGFRGGRKVQRTAVVVDCPNLDGTVQSGYAHKGESIVGNKDNSGAFTGQLYNEEGEDAANAGGRGNRSIGAGGGNCTENGGAGGGNAGKGGSGGESFLAGVTGTNRGGMGGAPITYPLADPAITSDKNYSRITMGGGGGAGEQKNGVGSAGGVGGGAIFLRANALAGSGKITANGEDALNATLINTGLESDGAGGGGAGGSVLVRVVGDATCGAVEVKGGKGGDSEVVGASVFGPGGGGGGGRALVQSDSGTCTITATAGAAGQSGGQDRNATAGAVGSSTTIDPVIGGLCTTNNAPAQCANPNPACDTSRGFCTKCNGGFGSNSTLPCEEANKPACKTDGTCEGCTSDFGVGSEAACQVSSQPYCITTGGNAGQCGKCTNDTDCAGPVHAGPKCNTQAGACGQACTMDSDCKNSEWCAQGVCIPKTPNGQPVSNLPPDTNGQCTPPVGQRTCASGACEPDDDLCGLHNGSPCDGVDAKCRSNICFPGDKLCGKPAGEPCTGDVQCRSNDCNNGLCTGCLTDTDCPGDKLCDTNTHECVSGCRPGAQPSDGGTTKGLCPPGDDCKPVDGGDIGQCVPGADAGADGGGEDGGAFDAGDTFQAGVVAGGGCSCRTSLVSATPPFALFGAAAGVLLFARRRRKRQLAEENVQNRSTGSQASDDR